MSENEFDKLIQVLELSVKKNGEQPLTNKRLLHICKLVNRAIEKDEEIEGLTADHYNLM